MTLARLACLPAVFLGAALVPGGGFAKAPEWLLDQARMGRFHGVAVVADADGVRQVFAHGHADPERTRDNGDQVAYPLGSIAKPLTALAVMALVEAGKLELDDSVSRHLPALAGKPAAAVTLRQLLSHSGGVPSVMRTGQGLDDEAFIAAIDQPMAREALLAEFIDAPLLFPPGSRYGYSNSGYVLLAAVLEAIDERPWAATLQARVLGPAGISSACLCGVLPGRFNAVPMEGLHGAPREAAAIHPDRALGAGGMVATPDAMLDLVAALRAEKVVSLASLEHMWTPVVGTGNQGNAYGLGWEIHERDGRRLVGHAGGLPGTVAQWRFDPESGAAVLVVVNRTLPIEALGRHQALVIDLGDALLAETLGLTGTWPVPRLAPVARAAHWAGDWRIDAGHGFRLAPEADGSLRLQPAQDWSVFNLRQRQRLASPAARATARRVDAWARGDAGPLHAALGEEMAAELDPEQLAAIFRTVAADLGGYRESWVYATAQGAHRVRFRFEQGAVDIAMLHDAEGRIAGLRLDGSEREPPPREARLWPLADGGLLLDRFAQGQGDQVWTADADGTIVLDAEAPLRAERVAAVAPGP